MAAKISSHRHLNPDQRDFIRSNAPPAFLVGGALGSNRTKEIARLFAKRFKIRIHSQTVRHALLEYRRCCDKGSKDSDNRSHKNYKSTPVFRLRRNCGHCVH